MNKLSLFCCLSLLAGSALAEGVPLKDGRYVGKVVVLELTEDQKKAIEHFRTCHLASFKTMNQFTPYVFELTAGQSKALSRAAGVSPRFFEVYETDRGFNDTGPHWNLALRFSETQIEIPLDLLLSDKEAKKAHDEQGWIATNPCFPAVGRTTEID
ncbi:hypothetical protein [Noviluteimonas gilva]|uniref:Uncharacterized protein n=1 Tax=Noviluteimonas gilva TaxID=2682097 RepID=A0A7C9HTH0_9GAMM|nr:hypothetical protein [Lysobacter gilvus]MUV14531.1 hypothetical protein [Lysobacter gilvus]